MLTTINLGFKPNKIYTRFTEEGKLLKTTDEQIIGKAMSLTLERWLTLFFFIMINLGSLFDHYIK